MFGPHAEHRHSSFEAGEFAAILRSSEYPHQEWFETESPETAAAEYEQMARSQA
jgi:hypothetical protein